MKIAIDAMGGDHAPTVNIVGARDALKKYPDIETIFLVGNSELLSKEIEEHQLNDPRVIIVEAPDVVEMHESGAKALRRKKKSSISIATDMVKSGDADAVVSAGNTGASVAAATVKLRTLRGVERAGIASAIPNEYGICRTDKDIDIYFPEVKQNYYNGWEYSIPEIKGKGKRVKNKTFKVKIDKDWICDLFECSTNNNILKVINIKKA